MNKGNSFLSKVLIMLAIVIPSLALVYFQQDIYDWWRLRGYSPESHIVELADVTGMNDEGRKLFYIGHPELQNKKQFNANCSVDELSIVLGCYTGAGDIYLYDVKDKRLSGVEEVTAAHEMLHVAYERLSSSERADVDDMTRKAFKALDDDRVRETIAEYRKRDTSVVPNELHSILGTEVAKLPSDLEQYYTRYFADRQKVVGYLEQYESEFEKREKKVERLDEQLSSLQTKINNNRSLIDAKKVDIEQERARLNDLRSSGNTSAYNAAVPGFNSLVNSYNSLVTQTSGQIDDYNDLVKERNSLVVEVQDLTEAIDSTPEKIQ